MVFTTNNVSDFHIPVVDHHTEVVGRGTVGTADDQIVQFWLLNSIGPRI